MAKFKPGESGNPKGRPAGSVNVVTKDLRNKLKAVIDIELENLPDLLSKLEPRDRIDLLVKLLKYTLPTCTTMSPSYGEPTKPMNLDDFDMNF